MGKRVKTAISPTRNENYPEWYQSIIRASELAENSPVRGCMVIKPWGYALWENIVNVVDGMFKQVGIRNAYFPLFIPLNFMQKEADHVEGFAKECAIVTHHRLERNEHGKLIPGSPLQDPLVVRPTSETIIGESFSRWVKSYRDLPVLINQWGNVVRWEMRTRMFMRTSEFLWQEGHTVHATAEEAEKRTKIMLDIYEKLAEQYLAIPVIKGRKSKNERFPGALDTLCIEAIMQDKKALQMGTSHFLGQNFSRASNIRFQTQRDELEFAWTTSWGVSTRLIGGIIMTHGDDNGMVMPPRVASSHVVLLPIFRASSERNEVMDFVENLSRELNDVYYHERKLSVEIDSRDIGGTRNWDWIKKGIPIRIEIGPRDIKEGKVCIRRRDKNHNDKISMSKNELVAKIPSILDEIQNNMLQRAKRFKENNTLEIDSYDGFRNFFTPKDDTKPEIHGGFALSHWCGKEKCEAQIKDDLSVSVRCIPLAKTTSVGNCVKCKEKSIGRVAFSKAY